MTAPKLDLAAMAREIGNQFLAPLDTRRKLEAAILAALESAHLAGQRLMQWQPIETAPRDGARILLGGCGGGGPSVETGLWGVGRYNHRTKAFGRGWVSDSGNADRNPTLWMPLPALPELPDQEQPR